MSRGGALEAGDLAAHAHPLEGPLERALHRQGDLRDSELRHVAGSSSGMGGAAGGAIGIKIAHGCCRLCYKTAAGQAKAERRAARSEEHTSELQSLMRISYAVFCVKTKPTNNH